MKRIMALVIGLALILPGMLHAAGKVTTVGTMIPMAVLGEIQRVRIPITFTADDADHSTTDFTLDPGPFGILGWYLYSVETNQGATGPSNGVWDLDITDADGYVVSQSLADDRSSTVTQQVCMGSSGHYPIIQGNWTVSIGDNAVNSAVVVVYLTFTAN